MIMPNTPPPLEAARLVIIRGAPGSGKSTLASSLLPNGFHLCEADFAFIDKRGWYQYDPSSNSISNKYKPVTTYDLPEKYDIDN